MTPNNNTGSGTVEPSEQNPNVAIPSRRLEYAALGLVLVFAAWARLSICDFGLPYSHHWDEPVYLKMAHHMLQTGDLNHKWFRIPPLTIYMHAAVQTALYWKETARGRVNTPNDWKVYGNERVSHKRTLLTARRFTVFLSLVCIFLLWRLGLEIADRKTALAAAAFCALSVGLTEHALLLLTDTPLTLFTVWTLLCATRLWKRFSVEYVVYCGICLSLAAASKYNGAFAGIAVATALGRHFLAGTARGRDVLILCAAIVVTFSIAVPYWFLDFRRFVAGIGNEFQHYGANNEFIGLTSSYGLFAVKYFAGTGLGAVPFLLGVYGLARLIVKNRNAIPVLLFFAGYALLLVKQNSPFVRHSLPILPVYCLFAAYGLTSLLSWMKDQPWITRPNRRWAALVLLLALGEPALRLGLWANSMHHQDSRSEAVAWLRENTKPTDLVVLHEALRWAPRDLQRIPGVVKLAEFDRENLDTLNADYILTPPRIRIDAGYVSPIENAPKELPGDKIIVPPDAENVLQKFGERRRYPKGTTIHFPFENIAVKELRTINPPVWILKANGYRAEPTQPPTEELTPLARFDAVTSTGWGPDFGGKTKIPDWGLIAFAREDHRDKQHRTITLVVHRTRIYGFGDLSYCIVVGRNEKGFG